MGSSTHKEGARGETTGSPTQERWATFDCYGTLIDWNGGIRRELERLFGVEPAPRLVERYHAIEPELQRDVYRPYREILTLALLQLAEEESLAIPEGDSDALARALPEWEPFPDVPPALEELRLRGWRLAILSNSDRDLIEASRRRIGIPFDRTIVAEEIGSYKPSHRHWEEFFDRTRADRQRHVHVAASLFHDIAPATELGLASVWVNRLGEEARLKPIREIADLSPLPDVLDELVAA
jgi:2-haloacid dehalogenase